MPGLVVIVSVDAAVAGFGVKPPPASLGKPLTLRVTSPVKPLVGVIAVE